MIRNPLLIGIALLWASLHAPIAWSHPHVFIHTTVDAVFDDKGLAGFRIRWVFDEMFSGMIRMDFDRNDNQKFEPAEVAAVKEGAFSNLKSFDYFVHIHINGEPFRVQFVKDFSAAIHGNKMTYTFFVPCHVRATSSMKKMRISVYDPEFYSSIFLIRDPLGLENAEPFDVSYRVKENPEEAYYFGQIIPQEIHMRFKRKP
jgi:ABC-type uncharacterized transport system substrate-binding protein